mmetsp:Transcript_9222/g.10518  ORF Transcript_9222/g.10518 Transcript_9222/m.10518 type:complete len:257 (-) Transcript_9222:328-1098(-)
MEVPKWQIRRFLAFSVGILVVFAYVSCIAISKSNDIYVGGLTFPYFSDTGREKPASYIFSSFITLASIALVGFSILQYQYMKAWNTKLVYTNVLASVFLFVAAFCSATLSIVSSNESLDIHFYSAISFFVLTTLYVIMSFVQYRKLMFEYDEFASNRLARNIVMGCLFVFFMLYIPIGLSVVCDFEFLSLLDCIDEEELGAAYCLDLQNEDEPGFTVLYDYTGCLTENHLRSSTQFLTIVSMMSWIILQAFDPIPQ